MNKSVLVVVGTRPAAIKTIPVYKALKKQGIQTYLCATYQQRELLQQVFDIFHVTPDISCNVMQHNQTLFDITQATLEKLSLILEEIQPSLVLVHGDTTTAFCGALASFYKKITIGHLEAGLRTGDILQPYPEEMNRRFISMVAGLHFAPTALSVANLLSEGVARNNIFCTGNVIVDALLFVKKGIETKTLLPDNKIEILCRTIRKNNKKLILLTAHRRESLHGGLLQIFKTIKTFLNKNPDAFIVFPCHPNPLIKKALDQSDLASMNNIAVIEPVDYISLVFLLFESYFVVTDSGGIQEEAMSLKKPVIILRNVTERIEGIWEGLGILAGTDEKILAEALDNFYQQIADNNTINTINTLYGSGDSSEKIVGIIRNFLHDHAT